MDLKFKADLPYPETDITEKSPFEVRLLMPAYGGSGSETTAIMTYIYQAYVLGKTYPEIATALENISMTEMHHHEILGEAIVALGGTPYIGGNRNFWQGGFVNYTRNVSEIIKADIIGEKEAIKYYNEIADRTQMESVRKMVERIILDEEIHVATLNEIQDMLKAQ